MKGTHSVRFAVVTAVSFVFTAQAATPSKTLSAQADAFAASQSPQLQPLYRAAFLEGERNAVLNLDRLGLAAMELGEFAVAERALDAAIARIETIYANNAQAKKARGLFAAERVKDFKGEPYERAMTYLYRGLLYARVGDFENARAAFLAADQQSMMGESEDYQSTFGLMSFLGSWASTCGGDAARSEDLLRRAVELQPTPFSGMSAGAHLLLVDAGVGPEKFGTGKYSEKLAFRSRGAVAQPFEVSSSLGVVDGASIGADLNWQATTRGGRPIDAILAGKAQWKQNTTNVASAATTVGYYSALQGAASGNNDLMNAGGITMALGLVGGLVGKAMTPAADLRSWEGLPAAIVIGTAPGPAAEPAGELFFRSAEAAPSPMPVVHRLGNGTCSITWARTDSSISASTRAVAVPDIQEKGRAAGNEIWRDYLRQTFPVDESSSIAGAPAVAQEVRP